MGSYHQTCAISQLPILAGDACRLLFLIKSPEYDQGAAGYTESFALWSPWSFPILGTYGDFGRLDIEPNWHTEFIQRRLIEAIVEQEPENKFTPAVSKLGLVIPDWWKQLQDHIIKRDQVLVHPDPGNMGEVPQPLGMCFIREDIYQALQAPLTGNAGNEITYESLLRKEQDRYISVGKVPSLNELGDAVNKLGETTFGKVAGDLLNSMDKYRRQAASMTSHGPPGYIGTGAYHLLLYDRLTAGGDLDSPELQAILTAMVEFRLVLMYVEHLRLLWTPQRGLGSQGTNWNTYLTLAKAITEVATANLTPLGGSEEGNNE